MGITEILERIWLFSANKIKISTHIHTQLIIAAHNYHNELMFVELQNLTGNYQLGKPDLVVNLPGLGLERQ